MEKRPRKDRGHPLRQYVRRTLRKVAAGKMDVEKATELMLEEMWRSGRVLVFDESTHDMDGEVAVLGFSVDGISFDRRRLKEMKRQLRGKIFVTRNGQYFHEDVVEHYYGLFWVESEDDAKTIGRRIEEAMSSHDFARHLGHVVRV